MAKRASRDAAEIAARRVIVASLHARRLRQDEIAEQLKVDQSTISRDLAAISKEWREQARETLDETIARELAELSEMERDCALQFSSKKEVDWIDQRRRIKERRAKLLGLDSQKGRSFDGKVIIELIRRDEKAD